MLIVKAIVSLFESVVKTKGHCAISISPVVSSCEDDASDINRTLQTLYMKLSRMQGTTEYDNRPSTRSTTQASSLGPLMKNAPYSSRAADSPCNWLKHDNPMHIQRLWPATLFGYSLGRVMMVEVSSDFRNMHTWYAVMLKLQESSNVSSRLRFGCDRKRAGWA